MHLSDQAAAHHCLPVCSSSGVTDAGIQFIAQLPSLQVLSVRNTAIKSFLGGHGTLLCPLTD
jgi:hypothetical protein